MKTRTVNTITVLIVGGVGGFCGGCAAAGVSFARSHGVEDYKVASDAVCGFASGASSSLAAFFGPQRGGAGVITSGGAFLTGGLMFKLTENMLKLDHDSALTVASFVDTPLIASSVTGACVGNYFAKRLRSQPSKFSKKCSLN